MKSSLQNLMLVLLTSFLFACGGGGSLSKDPTPGTGDDETFQVQLSLVETDSGESTDAISAANPMTVIAKVTDSSGSAENGAVVTFTFDPAGMVAFHADNQSGTAVTNAQGIAELKLLVGDISGGVNVTATLASGESGSIGFTSAGDGGAVGGEQPAFMDFYASAVQLASSGSDEVELIALLKNANSGLMADVDVTFKVVSVNGQSNGSLSASQSTSGADGTARTILTTTNQPQNRTITITATAGSLTQSLDVEVVGTDVKINAPTSVVLNDSADITFVLADSDGKGIANQTLNISSSLANTLSDTSPVTDETGQVTIRYQANNSGTDVITANALNASSSANISVQQDQFSFTTIPNDSLNIPLNSDAAIGITWLRQGNPFAGGDVTFSSTRGVLSTSEGVTDANGRITLTVNSQNAGPALITAQGEDSEGNVVNARAEIEFIAVDVDSIIVQAGPKSIGPDGQKSTITAVLRDSDGNLVKGKTVNFTLEDVSGGSINPASVVTDSNGLASTVYTSNTVTSEDGVTITASENTSGLAESVTLTVGNRAQFITIGTGNKIEILDDATYRKTFSVFVTDAESNPVKFQDLTVTGTPVRRDELLNPDAGSGPENIRPAYHKGYWSPYPSADAFEYWVPVYTFGCPNEDRDYDGILDLNLNEDTNRDGELTPGNIGAIDGNITTDENGQALLRLSYPKSLAPWATVKVTVSTPVTGSESEASLFFTLSAAAEDLTIESTAPNDPEEQAWGDGRNFVEDPLNPGTFIDDGSGQSCANRL